MDHWRRLSRRRNIAAMQGLGLPIAGRRWMRAWLGLGPTDCRSLLLKQGGRTDPRLRLYRRLRQLEREFDRLIKPSRDRKSTRLNSSHVAISYAVFCLRTKKSV